MAHKHSVYDSDTHFSINPITRALKNEGSAKTTVMQYDHDSERFTFEIPRMIEGHDMSICDKVEVHYNNIDAQTKEQSKGLYVSDDLQISPDSEDVVICSWLISRNATKFVGSLNFVIKFRCTAEDGTTTYAWNTAICSSVAVSNGIDNGDVIAEEYADILNDWRQELEASMIVEMKQTVKSVEDGGTNVWTAFFADGKIASFEVRNGSTPETVKGLQSGPGENSTQKYGSYALGDYSAALGMQTIAGARVYSLPSSEIRYTATAYSSGYIIKLTNPSSAVWICSFRIKCEGFGNNGWISVGGAYDPKTGIEVPGLTASMLNKIDVSGIDSTLYYITNLEQPTDVQATAEGWATVGAGMLSHAEGGSTLALGERAHAEGSNTKAIGFGSHAEGVHSMASAMFSHAEGGLTVASGERSHAEGSEANATGFGSHAEGLATKATANGSHAEGHTTQATGTISHAEGYGSIASGGISHAEGRATVASNDFSHAEGVGTRTSNWCQHVGGRYNKDESTAFMIVGCGVGPLINSSITTETRENCFSTGVSSGNKYIKIGDTFITEAQAKSIGNAAASGHKHSASDITSGTLNSARLPTVPVTKGGTGATTAADALVNLGIRTRRVHMTLTKISDGYYMGSTDIDWSAVVTNPNLVLHAFATVVETPYPGVTLQINDGDISGKVRVVAHNRGVTSAGDSFNITINVLGIVVESI